MKRILVTGANKGIGLAIVQAILSSTAAAEQTSVILAARDVGRGQQAIDGILAEHPEWQSRLKLLQMDVTDEASILEASLRLKADEDKSPLFAIVNKSMIFLL